MVGKPHKKAVPKLALLFALLILIGFFLLLNKKENTKEIVETDGTEEREVEGEIYARVTVDIADTPATRTKGLSGREGLSEDEGLLFVFDSPGTHGIWMKEMLFSIDIIWLNHIEGSLYEVVDLKENATPDSFPEIFEPTEPATHVLEVNAGWSKKNGVRKSSKIEVFEK